MSNNTVNVSKPKSSIIKDAIILFVITLVSGLALGVVYEITQPIIEQRALDAKKEAYQTVFLDAEAFVEDEELSAKAESAPEEIFDANGFSNVTVDEVLVAQDSSGNTIGHVMSVTSNNGYGGAITISLGYSTDGVVQGLEFLVLNETVGFGQNAQNPEFKDQFVGKQVTEFVSTKSGASADNEIDALSGATITTDAVTEAVNAGLLFLNETASGNN
ncbi:MAG: FMN-binding protein [Clostridiales bacterium]|nr:FMN-binding protein [Clostridiales bacterium]